MRISGLFKSLFIFCLSTATLFGQDSLSHIGKFVQGHPWTLDFGITSNLTLTTFQGTAVSLGKFTSDYQKYRFGISTYLSLNSQDQSGNELADDTISYIDNDEYNSKSYSVQATFQYLTYASPNEETSIYFGVGPLVSISWRKNDNSSTTTSVNNYQNGYGTISSYHGYSFGVLGSCGVEWFFSEHLSLHAEYGLAFQYSTTTSESEYYNRYSSANSNPSSHTTHASGSESGWFLSGQNVLFGLSVNY